MGRHATRDEFDRCEDSDERWTLRSSVSTPQPVGSPHARNDLAEAWIPNANADAARLIERLEEPDESLLCENEDGRNKINDLG